MIGAIKNGLAFLAGWAFVMCLAAALGVGCQKEHPEPEPSIFGPWKAVYPVDSGSGFWFLETGVLCRYAEKDRFETFNCGYEYRMSNDTMTVNDACGYVDAWILRFVQPDYIIATYVEYDSLTFHLKRDK